MTIAITESKHSDKLMAFGKYVLLLAAGGMAFPVWATNYSVGCGATKAIDLYNAINAAGSGSGNTVSWMWLLRWRQDKAFPKIGNSQVFLILRLRSAR